MMRQDRFTEGAQEVLATVPCHSERRPRSLAAPRTVAKESGGVGRGLLSRADHHTQAVPRNTKMPNKLRGATT